MLNAVKKRLEDAPEVRGDGDGDGSGVEELMGDRGIKDARNTGEHPGEVSEVLKLKHLRSMLPAVLLWIDIGLFSFSAKKSIPVDTSRINAVLGLNGAKEGL